MVTWTISNNVCFIIFPLRWSTFFGLCVNRRSSIVTRDVFLRVIEFFFFAYEQFLHRFHLITPKNHYLVTWIFILSRVCEPGPQGAAYFWPLGAGSAPKKRSILYTLWTFCVLYCCLFGWLIDCVGEQRDHDGAGGRRGQCRRHQSKASNLRYLIRALWGVGALLGFFKSATMTLEHLE